MSSRFDAIVVGARCAGSPTAMLLARAGHRVLLVDRATFPSDTLSTHVVHPPTVAALERWGLLERLERTGCPAIETYSYDFGPFTITGAARTPGEPPAYCPRRTVLDKLLVDAAAEAGAEVREGFAAEEILVEDGTVTGIRGRGPSGAAVTERAAIVVGADGWHSRVAAAAGAEKYRERPALAVAYYSYWSGMPVDRFEIHIRPARGFGLAPTHDGLTLIIGGWPIAERQDDRGKVEQRFQAMLANVPEVAEKLRDARRVENLKSAAIPNYFRKPYGPGWALVGDAGYLKDSITAQGIHDAFRDAERCARAITEFLGAGRSWEEAGADYQRQRDEAALPMYEFTCELAKLEPPTPEQAALFAAIHRSPAASDEFVRMNTGAISPAVFFAPDNVGRLLAAAN
ncbi:MAG: FAD-dependent monooxygenase [Thermoanaerobaculia bacterium]|nr:MAG: FAD-dependent monooxygenase [Thermoanaerobaculia bacterium]